jgi:hypothetical protein
VRQSKLYRQYESGNDVKDILGTSHLQWKTDRKEGVYKGHQLYDHNNPTNEHDANMEVSPKKVVTHRENVTARYSDSLSDSFNRRSANTRTEKQRRWDDAAAQRGGGAEESFGNLSPTRRAMKAEEEEWDESAEYEKTYDVQTGHQTYRKTGRMLPPRDDEVEMSYQRGGGGAKQKSQQGSRGPLTASERVKLREMEKQALAEARDGKSNRSNRNHHNQRGGVPVDDDVYGPGGEEGLMENLDALDADSLERLAGGLSTLKQMADEARKLDRLDKLKRELADLEENYTSPVPSPARAAVQKQQQQQQQQQPRGILKQTGGARVEDCPSPRSTGRGSGQQHRTDASKFFDNSYEGPTESHSHRTYGARGNDDSASGNDKRRQQAGGHNRGGTDASKFFDNSYEGPTESHSHRTYDSIPQQKQQKQQQQQQPLSVLSAYDRARATDEALAQHKIKPHAALRQSAPFAMDAEDDGGGETYRRWKDNKNSDGASQQQQQQPLNLRTARSEGLRDTKFW